jgi:hypothetical protein
MAISFQSQIEDGVLLITASGRDENLQQVINFGSSVIDLAVECGARFILSDERNLEYALDTFDTFQSAEIMAKLAPKVLRVAIVCAPNFLKDGKFWETVAVNRSLQVYVDTDIARAKTWLLRGTEQRS